MHRGAPGGTSSVQEHAPQSFAWINNGNSSLGEGAENERESEDTYPFGCVVLERVEGVRGSDDSSIAKKRRINK
jgi:hypothetical protein